MATKVTISSFCTAIEALIAKQGLDIDKMINAVNSALGELSFDDEKSSGKMTYGKATTKRYAEFRLTERTVSKFSGGCNNALRLYFFDQELRSLDSIIGSPMLENWPGSLVSWVLKFKLAADTKAA